MGKGWMDGWTDGSEGVRDRKGRRREDVGDGEGRTDGQMYGHIGAWRNTTSLVPRPCGNEANIHLGG